MSSGVTPPAPESPAPPSSVLDIAAPGAVVAPPVAPVPEPAPAPASAPSAQPADAVMLDDDDLREEIAAVGRPVEQSKKAGRKVPVVLIVFLLVALVTGGLVALGLHFLGKDQGDDGSPKIDRALVERNRYLREGWKSEATERLRGFLDAGTVEDRAGHVMGGMTRLEEMRQFHAGQGMEGADTPLAAFSHFDLQLADRERGLFLMRYERPAQFNMREFFRPVAPLEVQYDVAEPGLLLSSFAMLENFAMEPVRVMAFFKKEGDEMRLDWDVFVQTKYRMLKSFSSYPMPGQRRIFRVIVEEDLSATREVDPQVERFYRLSDPANSDDHIKVAVPLNSELGQTLSVLNWVGLVVEEKPSRTATVVLEWTTERDPQLRMREIVCWEFLGLGGEAGNAKPVTVTPPAPVPVPTPVPAPGSTPVAPPGPPAGTPGAPAGPGVPSPPAVPGPESDPVPLPGRGPQ